MKYTTRTQLLIMSIVGDISQAMMSDNGNFNQATLSRTLSGERSDAAIKMTEQFHDEHQILNPLFIPGNKQSDFNVDDIAVSSGEQAFELAESLYLAADHQSGNAKARTIRTAARLEMQSAIDSFVDDKGFTVLVHEERLKNVVTKWQSLIELVPPVYRSVLEFGVRQNTAAANMLLEKSLSSDQPFAESSEALLGFRSLFNDLTNENIKTKNKKIINVTRSLVLFSGSDLIETLVEAGKADETPAIFDAMVRYFGSAKADNIARFVYFNAWQHNQDIIKACLKAPVAA